jgi:hypothetical protein
MGRPYVDHLRGLIARAGLGTSAELRLSEEEKMGRHRTLRGAGPAPLRLLVLSLRYKPVADESAAGVEAVDNDLVVFGANTGLVDQQFVGACPVR